MLFFSNFARILSFSLYKGSLGELRKNWVTNWRPYSIPHSAINCIKEHPMLSQQPYYDSSSGAKVHNFFELNKSGINFFF